MRTFTDADGRQWSLRLTVDDIRRVRDNCDVDLLDVGEGLLRQLADVVTLVDVLHCLLVVECEARQIDPVEFAGGLRGDALDDASRALMEALIDFFPSRRQPALRKLHEKAEALLTQMQTRTVALLDSDRFDQVVAAEFDAVEKDLEQRMEAIRRRHSGESSTSGPESPASTPPF